MSVAVRARDYSKTAFDDVLQHHFNALLSFACQSDFSGENLVFFHLIQEWKAAWMTNRNNSPAQMTAKRRCNKCLQRQLFNVGVEIGQLGFVLLILLLERAFRILEIRWPHWVQAVPGYTVGSLGDLVWKFLAYSLFLSTD